MPMRVIVAGSPDWSDQDVVAEALRMCQDQARAKRQRLVIVHMANKSGSGAEAVADEWAMRRATKGSTTDRPERHPAQWYGPCRPECRPNHRKPGRDGSDKTTCPAAGFYRTDETIALGADLALIFLTATMPHQLTYLLKGLTAAGIDMLEFGRVRT